MLEAPVYPEIDKAFSFYGFELDDLAVLVLVFWFVETIVRQANVHVGHVDLTLYLTGGAAVFLFFLWRGVKIGRPRHLLEDALNWLVEPECWDVTPDWAIRPAYVIEPGGGSTIELPQTAAASLGTFSWH